MHARTTLRRGGGGAVAFAVAALIIATGLTSSAWGWKKPSTSERQAIAAVARHARHAGSAKIHVSEIRLSTVGPWATAALTLYFNGALDVLHRVRGR